MKGRGQQPRSFSIMPTLPINVTIPDKGFSESFERMYELAKSLGYKYPPSMDLYSNTQVTGKKIAIGKMFSDVFTGKLEIKKK